MGKMVKKVFLWCFLWCLLWLHDPFSTLRLLRSPFCTSGSFSCSFSFVFSMHFLWLPHSVPSVFLCQNRANICLNMPPTCPKILPKMPQNGSPSANCEEYLKKTPMFPSLYPPLAPQGNPKGSPKVTQNYKQLHQTTHPKTH